MLYDNHKDQSKQSVIDDNLKRIHILIKSLYEFALDMENNSEILEVPKKCETPVEQSIYLGITLKNIENIINTYKKGIDYLTHIEKTITFTIEKILELHNITEINDSDDIKISYRKCPEKLVIFDEKKLKYYFIERKEVILDKKAVIKDLKEGKNVDGAGLKREKRLQVKFKPVLVKK